MPRRFLAWLAVALVTAAPSLASAQSILDAPVSYKAQRSVTVDGRSFIGTVYHVAGRERQEQDLLGMREVFILNGGAAKGWLILPLLNTYVEFPFPAVMSDLAGASLAMTRVGEDVIAGIPTTKYRVHDTASDGNVAEGFLWLTRRGVLMKLDGAVVAPHGHRTSIVMQLSDLKEAPQDKALFALPPGMVQLPADALTPLLGGQKG
jgi:hypothetical protein